MSHEGSVGGGVDHGSVGKGSSVQPGLGLGLSVGLTLANEVDTVVGSEAVEGRVVGHKGSVGIGNQASISLGIGLTLADIVDTMTGVAKEAESVALGGQMVSGSGLVGRVQGHHGTVGVGHQTSAHVGGQTQNDLNII